MSNFTLLCPQVHEQVLKTVHHSDADMDTSLYDEHKEFMPTICASEAQLTDAINRFACVGKVKVGHLPTLAQSCVTVIVLVTTLRKNWDGGDQKSGKKSSILL